MTTNEQKKNLFANETKSINHIVETIASKKSTVLPQKKISSFLHKMTYNAMSKATFDKAFTVNNSCVSCGDCVKVCPVLNIELVNGKPKWKLKNCQVCFACVNWCPESSIECGKGTVGIKLQDIANKQTHLA